MKKYIILFLSITMFNCSNESVVNDEDFVQVAIPQSFQIKTETNTLSGKSQVLQTESEIINVKLINENGEEILGKVRITMPEDDSISLANLEVTSNLIEQGGLSTDFFEKHYSAKSGKTAKAELNQMGCFGDCKTKYKKGEGRGLCKAECWLNIIIKVAPIVLAIL